MAVESMSGDDRNPPSDDKIGRLIHTVIKSFDGTSLGMDIGNKFGILPRTQQTVGEVFKFGEPIKVILHEITRSSSGLTFIVSRKSPELLKRLIELEVQEISNGQVVIRSVLRSPGIRSKVVLEGTNAVDICRELLPNGNRNGGMQAVVRELRGEKIDFVLWSADPVVFVANALTPAVIKQVTKIVDQEGRVKMKVLVTDNEFPIALGKSGQNKKMAEELTGYTIVIESEGATIG